DLACTNNGVGIHKPFDGSKPVGGTRLREPGFKSSTGTAFVWHHPDQKDSAPPGRCACDHADMGPHGHQGLITVKVTHGHYQRTATYMGTNTGKGSDPNQRPGG